MTFLLEDRHGDRVIASDDPRGTNQNPCHSSTAPPPLRRILIVFSERYAWLVPLVALRWTKRKHGVMCDDIGERGTGSAFCVPKRNA